MHDAAPVGDGDRIVISDVVSVRELLRDRDWIFCLGTLDVGNPFCRRPGSTLVFAPAHDDVNRVPIATVALSGFRVGKHSSPAGHDNSRNTEHLVPVLTCRPEIYLLDVLCTVDV